MMLSGYLDGFHFESHSVILEMRKTRERETNSIVFPARKK